MNDLVSKDSGTFGKVEGQGAMNQHHDTEGIILAESNALAWHLLWPNVSDGWEGLDTKFAKSVAEPVIRKDQQGNQLQVCWL